MKKIEKKEKSKDIRKKLKIKKLSPDSSFYKNNSKIILFGSRLKKSEEKPKNKFEEFLSRAPINFGDDDE